MNFFLDINIRVIRAFEESSLQHANHKYLTTANSNSKSHVSVTLSTNPVPFVAKV